MIYTNKALVEDCIDCNSENAGFVYWKKHNEVIYSVHGCRLHAKPVRRLNNKKGVEK